MSDPHNLDRFVHAQEYSYAVALEEIRDDKEFPLNEGEEELVDDIISFIDQTEEEKAAKEDIP